MEIMVCCLESRLAWTKHLHCPVILVGLSHGWARVELVMVIGIFDVELIRADTDDGAFHLC